ncbi:MAG: hypothetical protein J5J00_08760 [Deltaproteobacteria bacterium]|nr:hypothetical protein [Deltaproteobacteria bacterium]
MFEKTKKSLQDAIPPEAAPGEKSLDTVKEAFQRYSTGVCQRTLAAFRQLGAPALNFTFREYLDLIERLVFEREVLGTRDLVALDDQAELLIEYAALLESVTNGKTSFIVPTDQPLKELVSEIVKSGCDTVLIDYNICSAKNGGAREREYFTGADVIKAVRASEPPEKGRIIVGFSGDAMNYEFAAAGANGAVLKLRPFRSGSANDMRLDEMTVNAVARVVEHLTGTGLEPSRQFTAIGCEDGSCNLDRLREVSRYPVAGMPS